MKAPSRKRPDESAAEQLARDDSSRKQFLRMVGGGGAAALALVVAACGNDNGGGGGSGQGETTTGGQNQGGGGKNADLDVVKYALTLEYLELEFYDQVIGAGIIKDKALGDVAKSIRDNEQEHVDALKQVLEQLGGSLEKPQTNFQSVLDGGRKKVLETAAQVENVGAAAYLGAAPMIESKDILASALAIHTVEGRHAAALNRVVGKNFTPDGGFAKPMSMSEVQEAIKPFLA